MGMDNLRRTVMEGGGRMARDTSVAGQARRRKTRSAKPSDGSGDGGSKAAPAPDEHPLADLAGKFEGDEWESLLKGLEKIRQREGGSTG